MSDNEVTGQLTQGTQEGDAVRPSGNGDNPPASPTEPRQILADNNREPIAGTRPEVPHREALDRDDDDGYMLLTEQNMDDPPARVNWWVRGGLIAIAALLLVVFYIATEVRPYNADGTPMRMASHQTIGMPACRFQQMTGMPCPSCGMTTSFALLVRGDIWNSMRANWVGTGLALFCAFLVPWCVVSAFRAKFIWVKRVDWILGFLVGVFTILMLGRWGVILLMSVFE